MIRTIRVSWFSKTKKIEKMMIEELRCSIGNLLVPKIYCEKNKDMCKEFYVVHDGKCKNCKCTCPCECFDKIYNASMANWKR